MLVARGSDEISIVDGAYTPEAGVTNHPAATPPHWSMQHPLWPLHCCTAPTSDNKLWIPFCPPPHTHTHRPTRKSTSWRGWEGDTSRLGRMAPQATSVKRCKQGVACKLTLLHLLTLEHAAPSLLTPLYSCLHPPPTKSQLVHTHPFLGSIPPRICVWS